MTFGSDLYDALGPLAASDAGHGSPLAAYCDAIGVPYEWVRLYAYDTDAGPGWSLLMSPWTCPAEGLYWLGQFVGVDVNPSFSEAQQRAQIASHAGFNRGTPASIIAAAQATLTGARTVFLEERLDGDAYALGVVTYLAETPNPSATGAAVRGATPAGIVVTYSADEWDYAVVKATKATYTAVRGAFSDYAALLAGGG